MIHMKYPENPVPNGKYDLFYRVSDEWTCIGGSIDAQGILSILLGAMRSRAGQFKVVYTVYRAPDYERTELETLLELVTNQPWAGTEGVEEYQARMALHPKHEWRASYFTFWYENPRAGGIWPGYHRGQRWNGWMVPHFTREVATKLLDELCDSAPLDTDKHEGYSWEWRGDVIHLWDGNADEEWDIEPKTAIVDGKAIFVWEALNGFTWDECTEDGGVK